MLPSAQAQDTCTLEFLCGSLSQVKKKKTMLSSKV